MKKILIKGFSQAIEILNNLTTIKIESLDCYRRLYFDLDENLVFSEDNIVKDLNKHSLILYNPLQLSINDKKMLTQLYRLIENKINHDDRLLQLIGNIETDVQNLVNELFFKLDYFVEANDSIDITKLLQSIDLKFNIQDENNFLNVFIDYIKIYCNMNKIHFVITFGLMSLLSLDEIENLKVALMNMDIELIDLSIGSNQIISTYIIDESWSII